MDKNIFRSINRELSEEDIVMLSPLQLAYIGDAVYELLVRTYLLKQKTPVKKLHNANISYVKAEAQASIVHKLEDSLREKEKRIVKKGRNAKSKTVPRNAKLIDYKYATGFEITGFDKVKENPGYYVFHAGTKKEDGKILTNGGRVLGVTAVDELFEKIIVMEKTDEKRGKDGQG